MSPLIIPSSNTTPAGEDLAEQAVPGHGIPSQDTDPADAFWYLASTNIGFQP